MNKFDTHFRIIKIKSGYNPEYLKAITGCNP